MKYISVKEKLYFQKIRRIILFDWASVIILTISLVCCAFLYLTHWDAYYLMPGVAALGMIAVMIFKTTDHILYYTMMECVKEELLNDLVYFANLGPDAAAVIHERIIYHTDKGSRLQNLLLSKLSLVLSLYDARKRHLRADEEGLTNV